MPNKKPVERAAEMLSRAAGALNVMVVTRHLSRTNVWQIAVLVRAAAEMLDDIARA